MYVKLNYNIKVGPFRLSAVNDVRIKKSIHSYKDTAIIKIPATARLQEKGIRCTDSIETAKQMNEGDKVSIELGYDDDLRNEFKGFVSRVNFTTPCELECEGYSWQLKQKTGLIKSWKSTNLKTVLNYIIEGTDIKLSDDIPDVAIKPMYINNQSAADVLDWIVKKLFLTAYFVEDTTLYVGLQYTTQLPKAVKYSLGWNTINDDELKFRRDEDVKVRVKAIYKKKNGKLDSKEFGEKDGLIRTVIFGRVDDMKLLEAMALKKVKEFRYSGYEGKITGFLQPYAQPGYKSITTDDKCQEKGGDYILESTDVSFNTRGGRRISELGRKINKQK